MSEEKIKLFVCGDVNRPERRDGQDAGIDLFVPNATDQFIKDLTEKNPGSPIRWSLVGAPVEDPENPKENEGVLIMLTPGHDILIPTYVKARIPKDYCLRISNKSGVATKQKLIVGAEIVDSSYEGVMHVHLFNPTNDVKFIKFGQKIAQAVPIKINPNEVEYYFDESLEQFKDYKNRTTVEEFYKDHDSARGEGGFGSTTLDAAKN